MEFKRVYKRVPVYNTLTDGQFYTELRPHVPRVRCTPTTPNEVQFSNLSDSSNDFDLIFSCVLQSLDWERISDDANEWVFQIWPELLSTYTLIIKITDALQETLWTRFKVDIFEILHKECTKHAPPRSDVVHTMVMLTAAPMGNLFGSTIAVEESPTGTEVDFQELMTKPS